MALCPVRNSNERIENDFECFITNMNSNYDMALNEIQNGQKTSHWIWYIFPQLEELGYSENAKYFGLKSVEEAKSFIKNTEIKSRLLRISKEVLQKLTDGVDIVTLMGGDPDQYKLLSYVTLFYFATLNTDDNELFKDLLFHCEKQLDKQDEKTRNICEKGI